MLIFRGVRKIHQTGVGEIHIQKCRLKKDMNMFQSQEKIGVSDAGFVVSRVA